MYISDFYYISTNECRSIDQILSPRQCRAAAMRLNLEWKGVIDHSDSPQHCYKSINEEVVVFNSNWKSTFKVEYATNYEAICQSNR